MYYRREHPVLFWVIVLLVFLIIPAMIFVRRVLYPVFFTLAEAQTMQMGNKIINQVIDQQTKDIQYRDLITYEVNDRGDIILIQANIREINQLSSRIALEIQQKLKPDLTIKIPLLSVFGFDMLSGIGPRFPMKIIPVGYISPPRLIDSFEAAGINQTRHKIYLQAELKLKMIVPFSRQEILLKGDIPVIEVTILGRVPEVYVDLKGSGISGILE